MREEIIINFFPFRLHLLCQESTAVSYSNVSSTMSLHWPRRRARFSWSKYARELPLYILKMFCISIWSRRIYFAWRRPETESRSLTLAWPETTIQRRSCRCCSGHLNLRLRRSSTLMLLATTRTCGAWASFAMYCRCWMQRVAKANN